MDIEQLADSVKAELERQIVQIEKDYYPSRCAMPFVPALRTKHLQAMPNREFEQVTEYLRAAC